MITLSPPKEKMKRKGELKSLWRCLQNYKETSFCEALEQMPIYVKFMKDFLTRKRKLIYDDKVDLTKECIVIIQRKLLSS